MVTRTGVVLGGGIGGVVAARQLRRRAAATDRIVLVERDPLLRFPPSLLWVLSGARRAPQITRDIRRLRRRGIEVVEATVESIDPESRTVTTTNGDLSADALVVAFGAALFPEALPGFAERVLNLYTLAGAEAASRAVRGIERGEVAIVVTSTPYKCPAAPYEAAFLTDAVLRSRGVRGRVHVAVYTPEPLPMPTAGPAIGTSLAEMLTGRDIGFHPTRTLTRVDPDSGTLAFADGGSARPDVIIGIPPHRPPAALAGSGLAPDGAYVPVDAHTLATSHPGVYALGDVTSIPIAGGKLLPKAGVFAEAEARVVAERIAAEWRGRDPTAVFSGAGSCFVELGDGRAAFAAGEFYAPEEPVVRLRSPGRRWHLAKVAFEQHWLRRWP